MKARFREHGHLLRELIDGLYSRTTPKGWRIALYVVTFGAAIFYSVRYGS